MNRYAKWKGRFGMTLRERIQIAEQDMAAAIMSEHSMSKRVAVLTEICNGIDSMRCEMDEWRRRAMRLKKENTVLKCKLTRLRHTKQAKALT